MTCISSKERNDDYDEFAFASEATGYLRKGKVCVHENSNSRVNNICKNGISITFFHSHELHKTQP